MTPPKKSQATERRDDTWVRHCFSCGLLDQSRRWPTAEAALRDTEEGHWTCRGCGGQQHELVTLRPFELLT